MEIAPAPEENIDGLGQFSYTSKFINDELDLIQVQQENVVSLASQLDQVLSKADYMRKLIKVMKKSDKLLSEGLTVRRKNETGTLRIIDDLKALLEQKRFEDIERYLIAIKRRNQLKVQLTQEQMKRLRDLMNEINMLYQEASGFCRLSQVIYSRLSGIYEDSEKELNKEINEQDTLTKPGSIPNGPSQASLMLAKPAAFSLNWLRK